MSEKNFEARLQAYNEMIKEQHALEQAVQEDPSDPSTTEELERMRRQTQSLIDRTANEMQTPPRTQWQIFKWQKEKQKHMQRLHEKLRNLDNPNYTPEQKPGDRRVEYDSSTGRFFWKKDSGETQEITLGQLLTDPIWGIEYYLDSGSVPRSIRKKYLVERTKQQIRQDYDRQVALEHASREKDPIKRGVYERILADSNRKPENLPSGIIAERIVLSFFKRLATDHGLPIEVVETDPFMDVESKVDFILKRKNRRRRRGVGTQEATEEDIRRLGIQFTTNSQRYAIERKEKQIERARKNLDPRQLDDLVLVFVPLKSGRRVLRKWQKAGSPPGGPAQFWDEKLQHQLFTRVLEGMLSQEEIAAGWEKISGATQAKGDSSTQPA